MRLFAERAMWEPWVSEIQAAVAFRQGRGAGKPAFRGRKMSFCRLKPYLPEGNTAAEQC